MSEKIIVPTLGESVTEATVAKWLKNKGDKVSSDEPLVELETDKVNVEVPSPSNGILDNISAKEGDTVNIDIEILRINFIAKLNCYVVNAVTSENNMVCFFTSKDESYFEGKNMTVKGRIKRCQVSKFHGGKETVLNYVKRVDNNV